MLLKKLIILFILCFASSSAKSQKQFNGNWGQIFFDCDGEAEASFCMYLKQNGNVIKGKHLCVIAHGFLIDEMEDSINGIVIDDSVAIVTVKSGRNFIKASGKAKLEIVENDSLRFILLVEPNEGGEHFFPGTITIPKYKEEVNND
ncbi:MAG: hypothetical protein R3Y26_09135 [Rikenellaceae bacterium]